MIDIENIEIKGLFMGLDVAFVSLNQEWRCIYVTDRAAELLCKEKEGLLGYIIWDVFPCLNGNLTGFEFQAAMDGRRPKSLEIFHPSINKWLDVHITPHEKGIDIFYTNITEGKLINKEKEHAEERFGKAFNSSPIPLSISRLSDECIVDVNESFLDLFEYERKQVLGNSHAALKIYGSDNEFKNTNELICYLGKKDILNKHELILYTKTGRSINVIFSTELILINGERHVLSTYIDITEKVNAQKVIVESETWFRSIADNSPVMIWGSNNNRVCNYVNSTWIEFTGCCNDMLKEKDGDWGDIVHPEDLENFYKIFNNAFDLKKPFQREYRLKRSDGEYRWISDFARPILMPDGSFKGYIGSCADIHIRHALYHKLEKLVKERTLQITLSLEKEKELNDVKSRFVSMASHEFRTPLSSILSSLFLIEKYTDPVERENEENYAEKRNKHIDKIKNSINHLTELLNDFLSLEKLTQGKIEVKKDEFDLKLFSEEIVEEIKHILKPDQTIIFSYTGENIIFQDKRILKNIYLNLLSNASKYSPENKPIHLNTVVTDKKVFVRVEDEGIGIPDEEQSNIFTKFFRAKNVFNIEGTGLGLNIVKLYLELLDGTISFASRPNEGTTFIIRFLRYNK
jgi:PAS domain S-box-containing protein